MLQAVAATQACVEAFLTAMECHLLQMRRLLGEMQAALESATCRLMDGTTRSYPI